jgi:hypothetical protein
MRAVSRKVNVFRNADKTRSSPVSLESSLLSRKTSNHHAFASNVIHVFEKRMPDGAGAVVSGFLIPYVLNKIEESKSRERTRLEAQIARQGKIIEAQSQFLDEITEILWSWRYLSIKVTFNADDIRGAHYAAAVTEYESEIWDVLSKLRKQISKSRRLISETGYRNLVSLYDRIVELDGNLASAIRNKSLQEADRVAALAAIHKILRWELTEKLDETIASLAQEVGLKPATNVGVP